MTNDNTGTPPSVPVALGRTTTGGDRRRRTDAERNRAHVLAVARRLVATRGIAQVTMDRLAEAAGVGKGTLYRGFGSRARLAEALLDEAERGLQERILTGPPPLGPGSPPGERLAAFVTAYLDFLGSNAELVLETERGGQGARFHTGAYGFWHAHVSGLLRAQGRGDATVRAHAVLAMLSADLYRHLRTTDVDHEQVVATIIALASSA